MTLLALGISHRSAPMSVLDALAMSEQAAQRLAVDLTAHEAVSEAIVLATCNRLEVYAEVTRFHPAIEAVTDLLAKATGADLAQLAQHSYVHFDSAALAHLFSVSAGLDSMVVGEGQILGQVRAALATGQEQATAGRELNGAVQRALRVGKRVHAETGIDRSGVSLVSVALDEALGIVGPAPRVLVVGAGSMGSLAAGTASARGAREVVVANRSRPAAQRIAEGLPAARVARLSDLPAELAQADIALFCTGATDVLVDEPMLRAARAAAQGPLVVVDLALPHDTDRAIAAVPGVIRRDLSDLSELPATAASDDSVRAARRIVAEEVGTFLSGRAAQEVEPVLVSLRTHAGSVLEAEMERLRLRLAGVDAATLAEVERSMRRAVATLLHSPTVRMKELAAQPGGGRYAEALSALFDLDPGLPASVVDPNPELRSGGDR